ncbi:MAG: hypothetical protein COT06_03870 [Syntrophobacteraceae bacterium CG07_land_8_20_14_0_80_61_8]|nr:MAG: hypothetical protein COT06_03870 [Syntrophobacteraceae bacterium CG07_land_8_20_14_0_80_61_8]
MGNGKFTLPEPDLSLIRQLRGDTNRLGFAVQLRPCCGMLLPSSENSIDRGRLAD